MIPDDEPMVFDQQIPRGEREEAMPRVCGMDKDEIKKVLDDFRQRQFIAIIDRMPLYVVDFESLPQGSETPEQAFEQGLENIDAVCKIVESVLSRRKP